MGNSITELFKIKYPIVQAGMIWCSGWELAAAVTNAGGLGVIGSGSMYPEVLREHIQKCKKATNNGIFAVNVPMLYPDLDKHMDVIVNEGVRVVITSAGNPKTWTSKLKEKGIIVVHVIANAKFAKKAEEAGVDAIVAEGFEAGGHNGREETTTLCLIPIIKQTVKIPVIAAGGIATGRAMLAMMALGADGVQIGSRFVASEESSANIHFKNAVITSHEGDTKLMLKQLTPVRLLKNKFAEDVQLAEQNSASVDELSKLLGRGRAKKGMFEGDMVEGELEIGQVAALIREIKSAKEIIDEIVAEYNQAKATLKNI
ncbi:MAG: DUF561 domain-containing protein [Bacteroidetes bacterium]|nr:DUF561 domain-containing protein [Bacteroidota bacterium]